MTAKPGDRVRLIKLPEGISDVDLREVFEQCVGYIFPVEDISDTLVELTIGERFGRKSYMDSIFVEYDCIEVVIDNEPSI